MDKNIRQQQDVDELFEIKTYYYIGAYQQCLNEINKLTKVNSIEKQLFMYRAYIALKQYRVVLDAVKPPQNGTGQDAVLQAVRKLAEYFADQSIENRNGIVKYFDERVSGGDLDDEHRPLWAVVAATVYYNEGLYESGLKCLHSQYNLECLSLTLQCILKMNRIDLAKKILAKMQELDDDATLTQLATAWLYTAIGGEKLQDAYYIYQDFCDKFMITTQLLNGQAVCHIGQEKFEEAEEALRESIDKDPSNYDALLNSICLAQLQLEKNPEHLQRLLSQIKDAHRSSAAVIELERKEQEFGRLCQKYEPSVTQIPTLPPIDD